MRKLSLGHVWMFLAVCVSLGVGGWSAAHADEDERHGEHAQRIVIHLGHATDDIHSADMALHMGTNLAKHGARVTMFLDREGVRLADTRLPIDALTWAENNLGADYDAFIAAGGRILVCPGCAGNQSLSAELLREGSVMGTPDSVAEVLLAASKVIDF